jgi:hypothetical protein
MAVNKATVADALGVPTDQLEADIKIRPPKDADESRRVHTRDLVALGIRAAVILGAMLLTYGLSSLFIQSGKPELAEKVVATLIGLIGGIGIGLTNSATKG